MDALVFEKKRIK